MQTIADRLATLEDGQCLIIVGPNVEHIMTETSLVRVMKDGTVKVTYEDGKIEERKGNDAILGTMDADNPSLFALVGYVKNGRMPCIANAEGQDPFVGASGMEVTNGVM